MENIEAGDRVKVALGRETDGIVFDVSGGAKIVVAIVDRERGPVMRTVDHKDLTERTEDGPADKPAKAPPAPKPQSRLAQLGLSLGPLQDEARGRYRIGANIQGVLVTSVDPGSPAGDKLRPGDVIVQVQGGAVKTVDDVTKAVDAAAKSGKPVALIAHTIKGKGVSFMEDDNNWHYRAPTAEEVVKARKELGLT